MLTWRRKLLVGDRLEEARRFEDKWLHPDPKQIEAAQLLALQARWSEAIANVPYYRDLVAAGNAPRSFASIRDFTRDVPMLTRKTLIDDADHFRRAEAPHHTLQTAGSTGQPLKFGCFADEESAHTGIQQWVARLSNGMSDDGRVFLLWGHSHLLGTGFSCFLKDRERRVKDWLMGYKRVDAYLIEPQLAKIYYQSMRRMRPEVVIGYACALDMYARYCLAQGLNADDLGIKLCVACSENFPKPDSREVISEWLGCDVTMEYGGVDFGVCAHEVRDDNEFRTFWWSHIVEVCGGQEDGATLVSNLTHRYLPLFRYRNGDEFVHAVQTDYGHVLRFGGIKGRIHDVLEMPNGPAVHSMGLFHCIHQEPVLSIQLVIKKDERRFRLAGTELADDVIARIRMRLADLHPDLGEYPIDVVADVATNRAGKRRWIVYE